MSSLLKIDVRPNATDSSTGWSALAAALIGGHSRCADILVDGGAVSQSAWITVAMACSMRAPPEQQQSMQRSRTSALGVFSAAATVRGARGGQRSDTKASLRCTSPRSAASASSSSCWPRPAHLSKARTVPGATHSTTEQMQRRSACCSSSSASGP